MSSNYIDLPSFGAGSWKGPVFTALSLPMDNNQPGDVRVALDTDILYIWTGAFWAAATTSSNGITALTGDGVAVGPGPAVLTLATVNANVGAYGSANSSVIITANAKGLITAVGTIAIQITQSQVTDLVADLAGKQPAGDYIVEPMTTAGDMLYRDGANVTSRLPIGAENQKLQVVSGLPTWTTAFEELFGGASTGNLTLSGALTLTNDVFYDTLTLNAGAALTTNGYKIFCKTLDLSNAPTNAIRRNGNNGNGAVNQTGGGVPGALNAASLGGAGNGSAGTTGTTGAGTTPSAGASQVNSNGGNSGAGGQGGAGVSAGGASRAGSTASTRLDFGRIAFDILRGQTLISGGAGAPGGSAGGGDGVNLGRGGGGGGAGGAVIAIYAHTIITSGSTASNVIQAKGGTGGLGASATVGNVGGGGGGAGAGGGYVYLMYAEKTGPTVTDLITASGGNGSNGGNGFGTGTGARGGGGGSGGQIQLFNVTTGMGENVTGSAGTTGGLNSGLVGGTGGTGGACVISL